MKRINKVLLVAMIISLSYSLIYFAFISTCAHYFYSQQLYIVQLGVYKEKKYVDELTSKLETNKIGYFIYEQNNEFFIIAALDKNMNEINNIKKELKQHQINFVIKEITYQDYRIDELIKEKDYLKVLERMNYEDIAISQE